VVEHDPSNIHKAREHADMSNTIPIGLFYQNKDAYRYDLYGAHNLGMTVDERIDGINGQLDRYAV